jgi:hypothetical protein
MEMRSAVDRVRKVEPHWSPTPSLHSTVEGEITANGAATRETETRYRDLQRIGCVPGPYAVEWLPARGSSRSFTPAERSEINRLGRKYGCHTCGTTDEEVYIPDHQLANRLNFEDEAQRVYVEGSIVKKTIKHAPPNSIIFVSDTNGGKVPDPATWKRNIINYSSSCICIGCYPEIDGVTEMTLMPASEFSPNANLQLAFDGSVDTPSRQLMVSDIDVDGLLTATVPDIKTHVRVWVNNQKMPDKVVIGWG